jgi:hypothetical protein
MWEVSGGQTKNEGMSGGENTGRGGGAGNFFWLRPVALALATRKKPQTTLYIYLFIYFYLL